jgi:hypothetical protein
MQEDIKFKISLGYIAKPCLKKKKRNPKKHAQTFTASLFVIAKTWKQPRCPSTNE